MLGEATGTKPISMSEPCPETYAVTLSRESAKGAIGLAASWNAQPRKVRVAATTQPTYVEVVRDFLNRRGIAEPKVAITQILRVDLEGDGPEEVLISATHYGRKREEVPVYAPSDSYSFVCLRRLAAGKVTTELIDGEFYPKAKEANAPNIYQVSAVLDLDGDGKLEVVVESRYYEGEATTIYRCTRARITPLLTVACGA